MTREEAIEMLQKDKAQRGDCFISDALDMAIASLKTDEAYQLEYENRDFVEISKGMTNGEVLKALFPNMKVHEYTEKVVLQGIVQDFQVWGDAWYAWWNSPYKGVSK